MDRRTVLAVILAGGLTACAAEGEPPAPGVRSSPPAGSAMPSTGSGGTRPVDEVEVLASDGAPVRAHLTIPALRIRRLAVIPYRGWTDDAPGTAIQDGGVAASPFGPRGGTGPGGIGNYQVTAHRTSSTRAFEFLPGLRRGQRVFVDVGTVRYVYEIRRTRETSFRSRRSLAEQRAAVPGRPGVAADRAWLTLSTCATQEDHAAGNYWSDEFKNAEHRIDKIGVLVDIISAPDA